MRIKREKSLGITPDGRKISINISNYEVRFHDIKLKFNNFLLNYTKISRERGYTSMKSMPIRHLSARVPWHDGKWGGNVCMNAIDNSFCRILPNVDSKKDSDSEFLWANKSFTEFTDGQVPPCLSEKGTFMSKHEAIRN